MSDRVLLRGGHVLSMDEDVGELPTGDVLVEDGRIAAVDARVDAAAAEVVDVSGHVVMPGFVDTHRHTWQTPFRGVCADWTLEDYFRGIRVSISPNCSAEDIYAGNYVGALEALDAGVTTILDFSHSNNTPEHADGALQGLREAGIRAMFAYGYYPAPAAQPVFTEHQQRLADARRIRERELPSDEGLVTMGVALTELGLLPFHETIAEVRSARELGVPAVLHTGCVWGSVLTNGIPELDHHGLLGPDQVHVRCMRNDRFNARNRMPDPLDLSVRDALRWGTVNGAHAMGLEKRIGSLTVGKQADVIVIGGRGLNMAPMADPVGCLVAQANPSSVQHVLVAGRFAKRDGALIGVDLNRAVSLAEAASERVLGALVDGGQPLLPPAPEGYADLINTMAAENVARAWAIAVSATT